MLALLGLDAPGAPFPPTPFLSHAAPCPPTQFLSCCGSIAPSGAPRKGQLAEQWGVTQYFHECRARRLGGKVRGRDARRWRETKNLEGTATLEDYIADAVRMLGCAEARCATYLV